MQSPWAQSPRSAGLGLDIPARHWEIGNQDEGSYKCWTISAGIELDACCVMFGGLEQVLLVEPKSRTVWALMLFGHSYDSLALHATLLMTIAAVW